MIHHAKKWRFGLSRTTTISHASINSNSGGYNSVRSNHISALSFLRRHHKTWTIHVIVARRILIALSNAWVHYWWPFSVDKCNLHLHFWMFKDLPTSSSHWSLWITPQGRLLQLYSEVVLTHQCQGQVNFAPQATNLLDTFQAHLKCRFARSQVCRVHADPATTVRHVGRLLASHGFLKMAITQTLLYLCLLYAYYSYVVLVVEHYAYYTT